MKTTYTDTLARVLKLLTVKPRTALDIARATKCSKPTAYARIKALRSGGFPVVRVRVRDGSRGPKAYAYSVEG